MSAISPGIAYVTETLILARIEGMWRKVTVTRFLLHAHPLPEWLEHKHQRESPVNGCLKGGTQANYEIARTIVTWVRRIVSAMLRLAWADRHRRRPGTRKIHRFGGIDG